MSADQVPAAERPAPPRFFGDIVTRSESTGPLEIRASATGALISGEHTLGIVSAVAASGGQSYVVGVPAAHGCTTQLWRLAAGVRGRLPAPIPLAPELHGRVYALATSARVQVVAYAITGCAKGQPGFIGVVHPASRRVRQWGSVSVAGLSPGRVAIPASPCRPTGA